MLNLRKRLSRFLPGQADFGPIYQDDLFLVSYPKSGNTWLSFLLGNVIALEEGLGQSVNFFNIQDFVPEYLERGAGVRPNRWRRLPRIIKSHSPATGKFRKVFLLVRDPRDVMVSYFHYLHGQRQVPESFTLSELVHSPRYGIEAWCKHTRGWLDRAIRAERVHVFRYEDLIADPNNVLVAIFMLLGVEVDGAILSEAIRRSSKKAMKELELGTRYSRYTLARTDYRFVRKGEVRQGHELAPSDRQFIVERAAEFCKMLGYSVDG
jgi:hypothetical protein